MLVTETRDPATTEPTADVEAPDVAAIIPDDEAAPATLADPDVATSDEPDVHPDDSTADAEDQPDLTALLADMTPAQIREVNPRLADQIEHNGAQRHEATIRKDLGNDANQQARLAGYAKHVEEHGSDPEQLKRIIQDRDLHAFDSFNRTLGTSVLEYVNASPAQIERSMAKLEAFSGNDLKAVANELIVDATEAIRSSVATTLSLSDVPEDSTLRTEIKAEAHRLAAEELKAQGIEAKEAGSDPAPLVPTGSAATGGGTHPLLIKLDEEGLSALSADEQELVRQLLK